VLALLGEGASLYGIQGLWTAARYTIPVAFVICNNAQYQILKIGARGLKLPQALEGKYEGMDLVEPEIDLVAIARGLGVEARRISEPSELCDAITAAWKANDRPVLFDVPIGRATPSRLNYG
jgi:benzoylformate decarboxylase